VVAKEQNRQKSGSVTDSDIALLGRDAGAEYVCVVERTELDGISYVATRMVSVQSKVAELADMTELPRGGKIIELIEWQIGSMLGMPVGPRPKVAISTQAASAQPVYIATQPATSVKNEPTIQGIIVPGSTLAEKLAWLQRSADSHDIYIVEVNADESIAPYTFQYKGAINITVVLRGIGGNRTIRLKSHGAMFTVGSEVTLILDNNITLMGHNGNKDALVNISHGTFKMNNGSAITGNNSNFWEGIYGGGGGGVRTYYGGTFEMTGGTISNNTAKNGGGVSLTGGTFTMSGGTISNNTASGNGGGVYLGNGTFTMRNGTIMGNIASSAGGGVWNGYNGKFTKAGGTITGNKNDQANGNVVKDENGNVLARRGHAVWVKENKRKETTAGPDANFSSNGSGDWDQ